MAANTQRTKRSKGKSAAEPQPAGFSSTELQTAVANAVRDAIPIIVAQLQQDTATAATPYVLSPADLTTPQQPIASCSTGPPTVVTHEAPIDVPAPAPTYSITPVQQHINNLTGEVGSMPSGQVHYDQGIPVDHHLPQTKRVDILNHQFVDLGTLLKKPTAGSQKTFSLQLRGDDTIVLQNEHLPSNHTTNDIGWWLSQFTIYATVLCRAYPDMAVGLFHYMNHIRYLKRQGFDWVKYDQSFRHLHASGPQLYPFGTELVQLQLQCTPPFQQTVNHTQTRGPLPRPKYDNASLEAKYARGPRETPFPPGTCWKYQRGSDCDSGCNWAHTHHCSDCKGNHPTVRCPGRGGSSEDRTKDRGGKGPSANRPKAQ